MLDSEGFEGEEILSGSEIHTGSDLSLLIELWRQRQDLRRAEQRLNLQCQAICRRFANGDKEAAALLWRAVKKEEADLGLLALLSPYRAAMDELASQADNLEKQLEKLARAQPLWKSFAAPIRGVGELSFAGLLGEAGRLQREYKSVAALWKRFGLAVIEGTRQRRVQGTEAAALHGYSPQRRSYAYVLETNLLRTQKLDDKYRKIYDIRKEIELERVPLGHAHNRALRYMIKSFLKDFWIADRELERNGS